MSSKKKGESGLWDARRLKDVASTAGIACVYSIIAAPVLLSVCTGGRNSLIAGIRAGFAAASGGDEMSDSEVIAASKVIGLARRCSTGWTIASVASGTAALVTGRRIAVAVSALSFVEAAGCDVLAGVLAEAFGIDDDDGDDGEGEELDDPHDDDADVKAAERLSVN